ncbi:MAG TPA: anaerobic ribonucleoside-triphosphate reductase activating protein [Clostridia bacterium]|nr:anaerobic ribonucleoside-triphosphate reductase activating protein [Clostridia bacterium]
MIINGIEKLSLVDYDGVAACVLFTGGCNFVCPFCHNSPLVYNKNLPIIDNEEIFDFLIKRKNVLSGVVITGGEPTLHADLPEFIKKIKSIGYKVKLDTNGTNPKMLSYLIGQKLIDYVATDIKNSIEKYALTAGVIDIDLEPVEESVKILMRGQIEYEFRTTLIKELHEFCDIEKIAEWLNGSRKYVLQKFTERETCIEQGYHEVEKNTAESYQKYLSKYISQVMLRGY